MCVGKIRDFRLYHGSDTKQAYINVCYLFPKLLHSTFVMFFVIAFFLNVSSRSQLSV